MVMFKEGTVIKQVTAIHVEQKALFIPIRHHNIN